MEMNELSNKNIKTIKTAAKYLSGHKRRIFQADVTLDYLGSSARKAERVFGWCRHTVETGLNELRTGIECIGAYSARGNKRSEEKLPNLESDIRNLAEPNTQVDPKFQSPFAFTRMTAKSMRLALIDHKGWLSDNLPSENTIGEIMNRLGYKLKRVQKAKPLKKVKETDAIFEHVNRINAEADQDPEALRISIDSKAKVDIGEYSRGGLIRSRKPVKALDHDMHAKKR
ncbi:MAG: hypothetical protein EX263_12820 [Flavobacteriaceae bacterium]|nr:MAG: hypothetical protein EX263_12820 [Flavobacteriaceae bacterium]